MAWANLDELVTLTAAIREHLARSPYVRRSRPGESHEGGDAVTIAEL